MPQEPKKFNNPKLITLKQAVEERKVLRRRGQQLVLTNGCFDLLHCGHLFSLQQASIQGDVLWVALNADVSVKALKGNNRPLMKEDERAYMLAGLECVHRILLFESERLDREIRLLQPDFYAKYSGYSLESLDKQERQALEEVGTKICFVDAVEGYSTTELIKRIKKL